MNVELRDIMLLSFAIIFLISSWMIQQEFSMQSDKISNTVWLVNNMVVESSSSHVDVENRIAKKMCQNNQSCWNEIMCGTQTC